MPLFFIPPFVCVIRRAIDETTSSLYNTIINFIRVWSKGVGGLKTARERGHRLKASSEPSNRSHLAELAEEIHFWRLDRHGKPVIAKPNDRSAKSVTLK